MNFDDWSDEEINLSVLECLAKGSIDKIKAANDKINRHYHLMATSSTATRPVVTYPDYCNNPADMWHIMESNRIGTTYGSMTNSAVTVANGKLIQITDKNPLRAAAIVFLIMKGVKPDERI